jgi:hypothetical protein
MTKTLADFLELIPDDGKYHQVSLEVKREFGPVVRKVQVDGEEVEF